MYISVRVRVNFILFWLRWLPNLISTSKIKMAAYEVKLRGPFTHISNLPPALNDDAGN